MGPQKFKVIHASVDVFGVCFYAESFQFMADVQELEPGEIAVTPRPGGGRVRSEWWRWAGYHLFSRLPFLASGGREECK